MHGGGEEVRVMGTKAVVGVVGPGLPRETGGVVGG